MADDRLRGAERAWREARDEESEGRYLRELLRVGRLERQALVLAALLGHAPARTVLGAEAPEALEPEAWAAKVAPLVRACGPDAPLRTAIAAARAVPLYGDRFDGPEDTALSVLERLDHVALAHGAERTTRASALRDEITQTGGGGAGRLAYAAVTLVLEPENAVSLLPDLLTYVAGSHGHLASMAEDLAGWLLGLEDPVRDRATVRRFGADRDIVRAVTFAPDGETVVTASFTGELTLRDVATGAVQHVFRHAPRDVYAAALSHDGARLLAGDIDGRLVVWDVASRAELATWVAHEDSVTDAAFLPDGRLVSVGGDGALRVWSADGTRGLSLEGDGRRLRALTVSPDGRLVVTASDELLTSWDLAAEAPRWTVDHPQGLADVAFEPDGAHLLTLGGDGTLRRWRAHTGELVDDVLVHEPRHGRPRSGYGLAMSSAGDVVATIHDRAVVVTRVADLSLVRALRTPGVELSVSFAPDGRWFLVGARSGALRRYDV